jgi:hypothetical protein
VFCDTSPPRIVAVNMISIRGHEPELCSVVCVCACAFILVLGCELLEAILPVLHMAFIEP